MAGHKPFFEEEWRNRKSTELNAKRNRDSSCGAVSEPDSVGLVSLETAVASNSKGGSHSDRKPLLAHLPLRVRYATASLGLAVLLAYGALACSKPSSTQPPSTPPPISFEERIIAYLDEPWAGMVRQQPWFADKLNSEEAGFIQDMAKSTLNNRLPRQAVEYIISLPVHGFWRMNESMAELIAQQPWFNDGLSKAELYAINGWASRFTRNPLAAKPTPEELAEAKDSIIHLPERYVSGTASTMRGDLEVIISFELEKTSREHAEKVRDLYRAMIPLFEDYMGLPFREKDVYSVFINAKGQVSTTGLIVTTSNDDATTLGHEGAHEYSAIGPYWLDEAFAEFVGIKAMAKAIEQNPGLAGAFNDVKRVNQVTFSNIVKTLYQQTQALLSRRAYVKGKGRVPLPWPNNTLPENSVLSTSIPVVEFEEYEMDIVDLTYLGFIFLSDLESAVGEEALRQSLRKAKASNFKRDTPAEKIYQTMREPVNQYAPSKLQAFDKLFEERVFGLGNLPGIVQ